MNDMCIYAYLNVMCSALIPVKVWCFTLALAAWHKAHCSFLYCRTVREAGISVECSHATTFNSVRTIFCWNREEWGVERGADMHVSTRETSISTFRIYIYVGECPTTIGRPYSLQNLKAKPRSWRARNSASLVHTHIQLVQPMELR